MFRNLSPKLIGVSARINEAIELALSFGFRGLDLNLADVRRQAEARGMDSILRFLESAKHLTVGLSELPVNLNATADDFASQHQALAESMDLAAQLNLKRLVVDILPYSETLPYHENFEQHRKRLAAICATIAPQDIYLGIRLCAAPELRKGKPFEFVKKFDELLLLRDSVAADNCGIGFDSWDWKVGEGTQDQFESLSIEKFVTVQLADVPRDKNPKNLTSQERLLPDVEGAIDCKGMLISLAERGYDGPVALSPHPSQFADSRREAVVRAVGERLKKLWTAAGLSPSGRLQAVAGR
jgi:sugar phosphate isomerase/epimerase